MTELERFRAKRRAKASVPATHAVFHQLHCRVTEQASGYLASVANASKLRPDLLSGLDVRAWRTLPMTATSSGRNLILVLLLTFTSTLSRCGNLLFGLLS
jgi:hypothetical protein